MSEELRDDLPPVIPKPGNVLIAESVIDLMADVTTWATTYVASYNRMYMSDLMQEDASSAIIADWLCMVAML